MSGIRGLACRLLALIGILAIGLPASLQASQSFEEGAEWVPSRVARATLVNGDVSIRERGADEWARLEQNAPVFEGDELYADRAARAEVTFGGGAFIRFGDGADVVVAQLDEREVRADVSSGTLTLSLDTVNQDTRVEVSAPAAALVPTGAGVYRVDVADNGDTWITILEGTAEVATPNGSFEALRGDLVSLSYEDPYDIDLIADWGDGGRDSWDRWSAERDTYYYDLARREREHPIELRSLFGRSDIYGLAELALHGVWRQLDGDRWGWQPREASRSDWAPYQEGYWDYSPTTGWTWISSESWGWAPYHYGRWDFDSQYGWIWTLRDRTDYAAQASRSQRYSWRPALVYMWQPEGSSHYAWVPLAPGESYRNFGRQSMDRQQARRDTVDSAPRFWRERRGVVAITQTGLERRERPVRAERTTIARALTAAPVAQAAPISAVTLPKPARVVAPTQVAAAKVQPTEVVKKRAVVVADTAPQTATVAAPKAERKAVKRQLKVERRSARDATVAQEATEKPAPGKARRGKMKDSLRQERKAAQTTQPATAPATEPAPAATPEVTATEPAATPAAEAQPAKGNQKAKVKGKKGKKKVVAEEPVRTETPPNQP